MSQESPSSSARWKEKFWDEAEKLIRLRSDSLEGNEELSNFLVSLLQDCGLSAQKQQVFHSLESASKRQFNVIGILGDPLVDRKIRKGLLLLSGMDTPSPGLKELWPAAAKGGRELTEVAGRWTGLGAARGKLDFLCKIIAATQFREKYLRMPIYLVGVCGAELGGIGVRYLLESQILNPQSVLVTGPTAGQVALSQKAHLQYRIVLEFPVRDRDPKGFNRRVSLKAFGRSAFAGVPERGNNAILKALWLLERAVESQFEVQITKISGGSYPSQMPDLAELEFYLASHQFEDFKRFFKTTTQSAKIEADTQVEYSGLGDVGMRFLPESVFPAIRDVLSVLSTQLQPQDGATSVLTAIRQRVGAIELNLDVRVLETHELSKIDRALQDGFRALGARYRDLSVSVAREASIPGFRVSVDDPWPSLNLGVYQEVWPDRDPVLATASASDGAGLFAKKGYDVLVFHPGDALSYSHEPGESVKIEDLVSAIKFYEQLIERVCL